MLALACTLLDAQALSIDPRELAAADLPASEPAAEAPSPAGGSWRLMMSPVTMHYHYDSEHRHVYMLGLERQRADGMVIGGTWFRNSFGQPSAYLYAGKRYDHLTEYEPLFVQLTGGLLYGYRKPFEDKVPLNVNGFSPGAVLSVGWQFTPAFSTQVNVLGAAALMFQMSVDFR